jgi:hypothetical protein
MVSGAFVEAMKFQNKKLIGVIILKTAFVFLVPTAFNAHIQESASDFAITSQSYSLFASMGLLSRIRFRWILSSYPISVILALVAVLFAVQMYQHQKGPYPTKSALAITLILSAIPAYYVVQFFIVSRFNWFEFSLSSPVLIGFCSLLLLLFVILPSVGSYSDTIQKKRSAQEGEDENASRETKRRRLSPKAGSYLAFLVAFLLPGVILLQSYDTIDYSNTGIVCIGFLLQFGFGIDSDLVMQGFFSFQDISLWLFYSTSIACCVVSLLFAGAIMRYVHGKGTKKTAVLVGCISVLPPVTYTIIGIVFDVGQIILPFPAVFIVGLLILQFSAAIEPERKDGDLDQSEISVPLSLRLKSMLLKQGEPTDKQQSEHENMNGEESRNS